MRIGHGFDSHRFGAERPLRLAGVVIPHETGLVGHSDGDAVAHAVTDAVLGAAALGDIGALFPDSDPQWKDANSMDLLGAALERVTAADWFVANVDVTILLERPRLRPYVAAMRTSLAQGMGLLDDQVSVKAKTGESMGAIGRGEGIAVHAVVLLERD